jgi:hypothetical protein
MVITGGGAGQTSFRQIMWQHMWDEMHEHISDGGGMGPYMGQGMNEDILTDTQQEM